MQNYYSLLLSGCTVFLAWCIALFPWCVMLLADKSKWYHVGYLLFTIAIFVVPITTTSLGSTVIGLSPIGSVFYWSGTIFSSLCLLIFALFKTIKKPVTIFSF